jgi:hypothetical protein
MAADAAMFSNPQLFLLLEVHDIENHMRALVHEHDMPANRHMSTLGRRRRQTALQFLRTWPHFLLQSGRQGPPHSQLLFQTGRKVIALRKTRGQVAFMLVIPLASFVSVMIAIIAFVVVAIMVVAIMMISVVVVRQRHARDR